MIGYKTVPDPSADQSEETIGHFLKACAVGDEVAIRNPHGGALRFVLTTVSALGTGTRSKFLYTTTAGDYGGSAWLKKSGRNGRSPGGQTRLVEPTDAVRRFIEAHPMGAAGYYGREPGGELSKPPSVR